SPRSWPSPRPGRCGPCRNRRCFFFSSRRRHTRSDRDWSSHVCSSDLCCKRSCTISAIRAAMWPCGSSSARLATTRDLSCARPWKIGRASCRERVEVWAAAEALREERRIHQELGELLGGGRGGGPDGQG